MVCLELYPIHIPWQPMTGQDPLGACLQREQSASMALEKAKAAEQRLPALEQVDAVDTVDGGELGFITITPSKIPSM